MTIGTKPIYLSDLHFEHKLWFKELNFYRDEIGTFENRLSELVTRNTNTDMLAKLEQYQNQFIRQKEVIDELEHNIKMHEESLSEYAVEHPVAIDHAHFDDHTNLRNEVEGYRANYQELKDNYYKFVMNWM